MKRSHNKTGRRRCAGGFALIVVLLCMVLLVILAIGLLQLSAVTLRTAENDQAASQAKANARLALMLAIGQLQKELGPDQRISAPSGMLDNDQTTPAIDGVANSHYTGVWNAGDAPTAANLATRTLTSAQKESKFRGWLVTHTGNSAYDEGQYALARSTSLDADPKGCLMVGANAASDSLGKVRVPILDGTRAGFAWWTSENATKATLRGKSTEADSAALADVALRSRRLMPDGHHGIETGIPAGTELTHLTDLPALAVTSSGSGKGLPGRYFHDLTTTSEMLPVDVTTGRLRKCLNLYLTMLDEKGPVTPDTAVPEKVSGLATLGPKSGSGDYRLFSWDQLRNAFGTTRNSGQLTVASNGRPLVHAYHQSGNGDLSDGTPTMGNSETNPTVQQDRWRMAPVLLKMMYVVSYGTEQIAAPSAATPERNLALRLYVYPIEVLWNPYNVDLSVGEYEADSTPLPLVMDIDSAGRKTTMDWVARDDTVDAAFGPDCPQKKLSNLIIPAGATRVLYPQANDPAHPEYFRSPRFVYMYHCWMDHKDLDIGPSNYGAIFKNLANASSSATLSSVPSNELVGAANDSLKITIRPSTTLAVNGTTPGTFGVRGYHTDWQGNSGPGSDTAENLLLFNESTQAMFNFETSGSPLFKTIPSTDLPSRTYGDLKGRPTPLFIIECRRKAADEDLFPGKYWAASLPTDPVHPWISTKTGTTDTLTPNYENDYTIRLDGQVSSWVDVSQRLQLPPDHDDETYFGRSYGAGNGQTRVIAGEIPLVPPSSIAHLQHLPLFHYRPIAGVQGSNGNWDQSFHYGRAMQFPQNNAIGNSYASPGITNTKITENGWPQTFQSVQSSVDVHTDGSYIANQLLWDSWFCSSVAPQDGPFATRYGTPRGTYQVASDFFKNGKPLPNENYVARLSKPASDVLATMFDGSKLKDDAYLTLASYLRIDGGFNVNSVSVEAWKHLLSGLLSRQTLVMPAGNGTEPPAMLAATDGTFNISRYTMAGAGPAEQVSGQDREDRWWNGSRQLTAVQLDSLSQALVREIKKRGPFLSLAEFVNRSLSTTTALAYSGPLQTALDDPSLGVNIDLLALKVSRPGADKPKFSFPAAAEGAVRQGIPGWITQADVLQSVGPSLGVRSDTFTIRAMGESRDPTGKVLARAWCEATVQRQADYLSAADAPSVAVDSLTDPVNKIFGRRINLVAFRWLPSTEVN